VTRRGGCESNKALWGKNSTILPYLEGKKVQITRFRPELQACHQNIGFQKIYTFLWVIILWIITSPLPHKIGRKKLKRKKPCS